MDVSLSPIYEASNSRIDATMPGFEEFFFSISKNVSNFLEPGTNMTISILCHINFLGSLRLEVDKVNKEKRNTN